MSHLLQFINNCLYFARTQQQHLGCQATQNLFGQLLAGKKLFGQQSIVGVNEADTAMHFDRDA